MKVEPEAPSDEVILNGTTVVKRNHVSVIFGNLISVFLVIGFILLVNLNNLKDTEVPIDYRLIGLSIALLLGLIFIFWRRWKLTTYTFTENELYVKRDTIFKHEAHIQYSKLASVNVRRNIINHIFDTTELLFNVNSSINSNMAEARLTLRSEEANRLRETISSRIFDRNIVMEEENQKESLVHVSNADIILHGLFGQPTVTSLIGLGSIA